MSITPVERFVMASKSQEASNMKSLQENKENAKQVDIHAQLQNQAARKMNRTQRKDPAENEAYKYDAKEKGKNSGGYEGKKREKREQKDENGRRKITEAEKIEGGHFDMSV